MRTYAIEGLDEAKAKGWPVPEWIRTEYRGGVFEITGGVVTSLVGWDGGEPEDQLLCRDWEWVAGALDAAYAAGRADVLREAQVFEAQRNVFGHTPTEIVLELGPALFTVAVLGLAFLVGYVVGRG